jgi:hypothetical protein
MTLIIVALAVLAVIAAVAWWAFDVDVADAVATFGTPLAGAVIIYRYGTLFAWIAGLTLFLIGAFAFYYLVKRRPDPDQ